MNSSAKPRRGGEFFSAKYFLLRGLALCAVFLAAHLAGLREYTTFLSGTTENISTGLEASALWGSLYIILYLGCVVVAPVLILAAGLLTLWNRVKVASKNPPNLKTII